MVQKDLPSSYSDDLTNERIITIANFLATVRGEVIERHDPDILGDTPLGLGMRAYECCRNRLNKQEGKGVWSWFSILTADKRFTFKIGDIPVRFTRNKVDSLPDKKFIRSEEANKQIDWLTDENPEAAIHWYIVIDTYYLTPADSIYFVGYSDTTHEIICKWEIPLEDKVSLLSDTNDSLPQPVEISEAPLKVKTKETKKS